MSTPTAPSAPAVRARPQTTIDLLRCQAGGNARAVATRHRAADGSWIPTTWSALWEQVQHTAVALSNLGLGPGDRLAVCARTCREWQIAELAAHLSGAAVVGIDAHATLAQVRWILDHSRACALMVDDERKCDGMAADLADRLKFIVILGGESGRNPRTRQISWQGLAGVPTGRDSGTPAAAPGDAATVIYTSGTTGTPKGVEYSHAQLMTACWAMLDEFPPLTGERMVCWLPMAALFQRMMNLLACASGSVTYFVEDPREIVARVGEIRPTIFTSVPRFYEKVHDGVQEKLAAESGVRAALARAALDTGAAWAQTIRAGDTPAWDLRIRHAVLDRLVLRKIRQVMGGEIKWMITGSAAAPTWLLEFFHSIGLLVLEAYGVTENPVPIAANRPGEYRFGSVGKPFSANSVRLDELGEVLVKGPAVFHEYLHDGRPAERFTPDGYYRTGDYGRFDADGFLYLGGRTGDVIKTSTGRRVAPVAIEAVYRSSRFVDQVVVVGNERPYLVALVTINPSAVEAALGQAPGSMTPAAMTVSPGVIQLIDRDLSRLGANLSRHEQVRRFALVHPPFSIEHEELTTSLKLRRQRIAQRHADSIEQLYRVEAAS